MGPFINQLYEECWEENQKLHKKVEELEEYIEAVETDREYYKNGSAYSQAEFTIEVLKKDIEGLKERLLTSLAEDQQLEEIDRLNNTVDFQRGEMERMVDQGNKVIDDLEQSSIKEDYQLQRLRESIDDLERERDNLLDCIHGNRVDNEKLEALELENKDLYEAIDDLEDMNKILLIHIREIGKGKDR